MTAALPPTERDFDAFRLVKIEQKSTRETAAILELSQTRVCQIVQRVAEFLVEVAPVTITEETRAKQLNVARWIAAERVDFLHGEAMRAWRASMGPQTTVREVTIEGQKPVTTVLNRLSQGDAKYLAAAQKYANAAGKICVESWTLGDYSRSAETTAEARAERKPTVAATPKKDAGCESPPRTAPAPITLQTGPVQPSAAPPLESKKLTPREQQARRDFLHAS